MLSKFLVRTFIKDYKNIENHKVRDTYGYLGGIIGIVINVAMFGVKFVIGAISNSISLTADAFQNLTDAISSIVTIVGFKIASKPADSEHPFGHGRVEYISGLIVSFMVLLVGIEFIKSSYGRITSPTKVTFQWTFFIIILLSIAVKVWLSRFTKYIGKSINSSALQASSLEALGDVFSSTAVALSLILSKYTTLRIDGYVGILISLFILYIGFSLIKETLNPLLGEAPAPELVEKIMNQLRNHRYIVGAHDLRIHNYGPRKTIASIHAEVPYNLSITKLHETIAKAEKEISQNLDIEIVIRIDPVKQPNL